MHPIAQHREPFHTHTKGKTRIALIINAGIFKHLRVHHAAAQHLQPAAVAADPATLAGAHDALDIDFGRRLGKGEIGRSETDSQLILFKEQSQEFIQHTLQVGKAGILVNQQAFHLVKHRCMRQIRIAAVDPAGRDNAQGWFMVFHHPHLDR